ncbi:DsbA family protein [Halocynthiibacter styelae]|uniref:DsbA family protein n=1 Tax=Halocynthiibacter styelae TaxID=2761955 RepID=A0A8J7ISJ1_9RHOB|nr:DsbA family protein [Paenihalocynthiibacter styelae]MBI1494766.1 DsbA family protein [Paenihalocynthiibacter styelae]
MQRRMLLGTGAAALFGSGAFFLSRGSQPGTTSFAPISAANAQDAGDIDTSGVLELVLGDENAPVTVTEYASYTCPHCATFHASVMPQLKANYIETGKVRFVYREVYFDRFGLWAGMLARCGGPLRYFGIQDVLYNTQREWLDGSDPAKIVENLRGIGKSAGISDAELDACFADENMPRAMLAVYQQNAEADGINSTPTLLVNGTKYGNMNYADLAELIDAELPAE